jgi:hypothetical protein
MWLDVNFAMCIILKTSFKIKSLLQLFEMLPEEERIIVDVLRQIILKTCRHTVKKSYRITFPFLWQQKHLPDLARHNPAWWD